MIKLIIENCINPKNVPSLNRLMRTIVGFIVFISIYLTVLGSFHFYFLYHLHKVLRLNPIELKIGIALSACVILTPIAIRILEHKIPYWVTWVLYNTTLLWLGFLWVFIIVHFVLWCFQIKIAFGVALIATAVLVIYGVWESYQIQVKTITLSDPAITAPITIVQISDIHLGYTVGRFRLRAIINKIAALEPDLIVSTGDLIDGPLNPQKIAPLFNKLKPTYGKIAITGNHEFYAGIEQSTVWITQFGFELLRNHYKDLPNNIRILGIDDKSAHMRHLTQPQEAIWSYLDPQKYNVILKHMPTIAESQKGKFQLQLSGHTHNGQIFPAQFLVKCFFAYTNGLYKIDEHASLYVNPGTGLWGPPFRLFAPPQITRIQLR